jgi:tetratricopeptide (TPR) repeat protein
MRKALSNLPQSTVMAGILSVSALLVAAPAQAAAPPPASSFADFCTAAKNKAVIPMCLDAANQYAAGNVGLARTLMLKVTNAAPKEGSLRMLLGLVLLRTDDAPAAERAFRQARKDGAADQVVLPPLFRAMVGRHEEVQLLQEFPEPAANAAGDIPAHVLHGRAQALKSLGRLDEAAAAMDRSLALRRAPVALRDRADIALAQNDTALAGKLIDEALVLSPRNGQALVAKLQLLERMGDAAKTLAFSEKILKLYPNNVDSHVERIKVFLKLNQDAKAKAEVDTILARSRHEPLGLFYQAVLVSRTKNKDKALLLLQGLPANFVRAHPELALQMAQIAFDSGKIEIGASLLGSALSVAPNMVDARLRLAEARMEQDSPQSALVVLGPVKDSTDPRVQKVLTKVRARVAKDRAF